MVPDSVLEGVNITQVTFSFLQYKIKIIGHSVCDIFTGNFIFLCCFFFISILNCLILLHRFLGSNIQYLRGEKCTFNYLGAFKQFQSWQKNVCQKFVIIKLFAKVWTSASAVSKVVGNLLNLFREEVLKSQDKLS